MTYIRQHYVCCQQRKFNNRIRYSREHLFQQFLSSFPVPISITYVSAGSHKVCLFASFVFNGTFSTHRLYRAIAVAKYIM